MLVTFPIVFSDPIAQNADPRNNLISELLRIRWILEYALFSCANRNARLGADGGHTEY